jgi:hypothetical protein
MPNHRDAPKMSVPLNGTISFIMIFRKLIRLSGGAGIGRMPAKLSSSCREAINFFKAIKFFLVLTGDPEFTKVTKLVQIEWV